MERKVGRQGTETVIDGPRSRGHTRTVMENTDESRRQGQVRIQAWEDRHEKFEQGPRSESLQYLLLKQR